MPLYVAFLGHQPHISLAELSSVSDGLILKNHIDPHIALFETLTPFETHINTLGSIVLLGELSFTPSHWSGVKIADPKTSALLPEGIALLKNEIPGLLGKALPLKKRGKVTFSIRTFGIPKPLIKELYHLCKTYLKEHDRPSRYIGNEWKPAPPIALHSQGILDKHGCELLVLFDGKNIFVGRTIAAHDPDWYTERDIQKPVRDMTTGLLPPKLAQVMLNFGEWLVKKSDSKTKKLIVYDPFCGSGVIPMEAMLRGWPVLASDISQRAINATEKNLEWLRKTKKIFKKDVASSLWKHDATKPFDLKEQPTVIVTETSLGEPLTHRPSHTQGETFRRQSERLEAAFLTNVAASLPCAPLVCTWPIWYTKTDIIALQKIWDTVRRLGYRPVLPPPVPPQPHGRTSLIYRRPDQFVGREIVLLLPPTVG
ncbi:RsmD family RNA methyltransferase [Candidatus Peregrinibacteria bacterium]|nr:RsmD family RNA methyltransferase [Candidatus Peregrinibacteria bacterium]